MSFHEVRFPSDISRRAQGGPERRTEVIVLGSGYEERNSRWADSRRRFDAGYGIKSLDDLHSVTEFFEERRGRLYGFRWRDHSDWKSCNPSGVPSADDQLLGLGDGMAVNFQLKKTYGGEFAPWVREINKPVSGSVLVSVAGQQLVEAQDYVIDTVLGVISFLPASIPSSGDEVRAGFEFDIPVRFDTDRLEVSLQGFQHGAIPNIPIVEVRL
ncbi:MAG: phage distal tail protein, Rcc01695 family [Hyphomicrobiaceae bacterium]